MKLRPNSSGKSGSAAGAMGRAKRDRKSPSSGEVSHGELFRAIECGWRHFWGKRGGAPAQIGWAKY